MWTDEQYIEELYNHFYLAKKETFPKHVNGFCDRTECVENLLNTECIVRK
jgi:hypothetical protein